MPLVKHIEIEDGLLLLWEITESLDEIEQPARKFLDDPAFLKITHPKRKKEWLAVRLLLEAAGCTKHQFRYNQVGQPCIDHPSYQSISISHSSNLVGIFLHSDYTTGLDIENEDRNFARVEAKYLSEAETKLAKTIPNGYGWFWCIKEAAYKAAGIPGLTFKDQINIFKRGDGTLGVQILEKSVLDFKIHQKKFSGQLIVYLTVYENSSV